MQVAPVYAGAIGGDHGCRTGAGSACQKVPYGLGWGSVAAADPVGIFLHLPLPLHSPKGARIGEVRRIQCHQQRGVGIFSIPVGIAHAVGHHPTLLRGRSHHEAPGTHTEGIYRLGIQMLRQLIVRRGQRRADHAVLGSVDIPLLVFNPNAHGEGLGLHGDAGLLQHGEGIPGAVADGQHHMAGGDYLPLCRPHPGNRAPFQHQPGDLSAEAHLAPQRENPLPKILHHFQQHIRTHMGLGVVENLLPGTGLHKLLQNPADSGVVHPGVQLAVGEGAGSPLAELDIAGRIQLPGGEKLLHLFMPGQGILPPFQHQRFQAGHGKNQRREHSGRAEAHHHRAVLRA